MPLQQLLRILLAARELQGIGELRLVLAGPQAPADAPDLVPQEEQAIATPAAVVPMMKPVNRAVFAALAA